MKLEIVDGILNLIPENCEDSLFNLRIQDTKNPERFDITIFKDGTQYYRNNPDNENTTKTE